MKKREKDFLLEYEKLCRKHKMYVSGDIHYFPNNHCFLRWTMEDIEHTTGKHFQFIKEIFFDDLYFEGIEHHLYDDDFLYLQDGDIKHYIANDSKP